MKQPLASPVRALVERVAALLWWRPPWRRHRRSSIASHFVGTAAEAAAANGDDGETLSTADGTDADGRTPR